MLEAQLYTAEAEPKGSYVLPGEYDGTVNDYALYHAVRAYLNNRRQGTHSTKTRAEVSGGSRKPWRQKGTGRARQGTARAPHWRGGGVVFGPKPRSYHTDLPRKVKRLARQSALTARAQEGAISVIEGIQFEQPKTTLLAAFLAKLGLDGHKVLILTSEHRQQVYLSSRNLPNVHVMTYAEASAYEVLWSDTVVVEEAALSGHQIAATGRSATGVGKASKAKVANRAAGEKTKKTGAKAAAKTAKKTARKGGRDA